MNSTTTVGEFLLYETGDVHARVECRFVLDSRWLVQALMITPGNIS